MTKTPAKRKLTSEKIQKFLESYTGISKYYKKSDKVEAYLSIIKSVIEDYGKDFCGYTYVHCTSFGSRVKRFTILAFPLLIEPERLRTLTTEEKIFLDTGWFPADDLETWPAIIQSILLDIVNHLVPKEDIAVRLGV